MFSPYVEPFESCPPLGDRDLHVLRSLPVEVQQDFVTDSRFRVTLENYQNGKGWSLVMDLPSPNGDASRCVVLRRKLAACDETFAHYVIAHEFAHAFLRNGGWEEISDREEAADALAASWGFAKPMKPPIWFGRSF
ncbi:MAG: hypothetical protein HKN47_12910 [Pirellulaceae bacterium]|nr:hypothetical protein [Pirellulaceae bacterium]